jgi:hypothetical protein
MSKEVKWILDWKPAEKGDEERDKAVLVAAPLYKLPVKLPWVWVRFSDLDAIVGGDSWELWDTFLSTGSTFAYYHEKEGWRLEKTSDGMPEQLLNYGMSNIYLPAGWVNKYRKKVS